LKSESTDRWIETCSAGASAVAPCIGTTFAG
jgi:hypothetical protein